MKKHSILHFGLGVALAGLALQGCGSGGTGVGNPDAVNLSLSVQLDTAKSVSLAKLAAAPTDLSIQWNKVEVVINSLKFGKVGESATSSAADPSSSAGASSSSSAMAHGMTKFDGTWTLNLLDGSSQPSLEELSLEPGDYSFLQIKSQKGQIEGNNIRLAGTATLGDQKDIAVVVGLSLTDVMTFHGDTLHIAENSALKASFDADAWFAGIDWSSCLNSTQDSILVNESDCKDVAQELKKNIKKEGVLEKMSAQ